MKHEGLQRNIKEAYQWDNYNIACLHTYILGNKSSYSFRSIFNPRKIHDVQTIQQNIHIILCPLYYWYTMHFTYITHCINKYFKPGSLHQFHKFHEYLHSFIKSAASITVILHSISCLFMSFSLLYVVTDTSIFAYIKLFPCLSNLLCGSSFSFHWCFGFDDRRGDVNPSADTS